jgi:hypothetical protein
VLVRIVDSLKECTVACRWKQLVPLQRWLTFTRSYDVITGHNREDYNPDFHRRENLKV